MLFVFQHFFDQKKPAVGWKKIFANFLVWGGVFSLIRRPSSWRSGWGGGWGRKEKERKKMATGRIRPPDFARLHPPFLSSASWVQGLGINFELLCAFK